MIKLNDDGFPINIVDLIQPGTESFYLAEGYQDLPHPPGWDYRWLDGEWIAASRRTLSDAQCEKAGEITAACQQQILAGFESAALGVSHHYPAKMTDQQNLSASVLDSLLPDLPADWATPFWCADGNAVWDYRPHTAAQIQQVGREAKSAILAAMGKNELLQRQIAAATSIAELETIAW